MTLLEPPNVPTITVDPDQQQDIDKFREQLALYKAGIVEEDVFRVFRLTNGIYGQRQGGTNQMIRVKVPYGSMTPDQLDMIAFLVEEYSRGWAHITTRQNLQFHYVQLDDIPTVMQHLASVGLTTREACGDTVRNIQGCHLAGACPLEHLDITPWAEATYRHFVRNPLGQRLPRKFKINFSGCETDCGQAMFNDAGVIATKRTLEDGSTEKGFRVFIAGGLGTTPHPAIALEDFTSREELLPTIEAMLRVFDQAGNRNNKLRARMKWLVETLGIDELRSRIFASRKFLMASSTWPGGIPPEVVLDGDEPAGAVTSGRISAIGQGTPVSLGGSTPFEKWHEVNVVRGAANGTVSAYACADLGDITAAQFRGLAQLQRDLNAEIRLTNRQNVVFRDLTEDDLWGLHERLSELGMSKAGAELSRDVVSCPGADTCNLGVTQSRGLAKAITQRLEEDGLAEVGGVRINISGCPNSCGQHHAADIGFFGAERRINGYSAPGYQMLLGGYIGQEQMHFGQKTLRLPAKNVPEATSRIIGRFAAERNAGDTFRTWMESAGGITSIAEELKHLDKFPTLQENGSYYIDYDELLPFDPEIGASECAT